MTVPLDLWTQTAALLGLRAEAPFAGGIWYYVTKLTLKYGFVCHPWIWLCPLVPVILFCHWRYFRHWQCRWLYFGVFLTGIIFAETPWILLLWPFVFLAIWLRGRFDWWGAEFTALPIRPASVTRCFGSFVSGMILMVCVNLATFGLVNYVGGYARNAVHAVIPDGSILPDYNAAKAVDIVNDYASVVAPTLKDAETVFTDGVLDDGLRLAGVTNLVPVFNGVASDLAPYSSRLKGAELVAFETSPSVFIKMLIEKKDERLQRSLFLIDISSDLVKYPKIDFAPLAERILDFYKLGGNVRRFNADLRRKFVTVHWRVSRLLRRYAADADRAGDAKGGLRLVSLADKLDKADENMRRLLQDLDRHALTELAAATPREGLEFALKRANFELAHRLATPILESDPDNAEANFAAAMDFCRAHSYALAEQHLRRALKAKPNEPAILNNLAMVLMRLDRCAEAEPYAVEALKRLPNSIEVKRTLADIRTKLQK